MVNSWNVTQRHIYQRCYSGMIKSNVQKKKTWFLTLTSNPVSVDNCKDWEDKFLVLQNSWRMLHKRIVAEFIKKEYGSFDYLNVRVGEAYGVIHVLYRGIKIPDSWIVNAWNEIHGSHIIDNRMCRDGDRGAAQYLASQYFGGQNGKLVYGYSKDWIYRGFSKNLEKIRRCSKDYDHCYFNQYNMVCADLDKELFYQNVKYDIEKRFAG